MFVSPFLKKKVKDIKIVIYENQQFTGTFRTHITNLLNVDMGHAYRVRFLFCCLLCYLFCKCSGILTLVVHISMQKYYSSLKLVFNYYIASILRER